MRNKAVHLDIAVCAVCEVEGDAADGRRGDGREGVAVRGERGDAAVEAKPDHYFEGVGTRGGGAEEGVVGGFAMLAWCVGRVRR